MDDGSGNPSVHMDAGNDRIRGQDWEAFDFAGTAPFTLEAWINPDNVSGIEIIIQKQVGGSGAGWELIRNGTQVTVTRGTSANQGATGGTVVIGTDHHVVATYDGATLKIYLDGIEVDSSTASVSMGANTIVVSIGEDSATGGVFFDGRLDEVAVYDRALTGAEVAKHYAIGTQGVAGARWLDLTRYVRSE